MVRIVVSHFIVKGGASSGLYSFVFIVDGEGKGDVPAATKG